MDGYSKVPNSYIKVTSGNAKDVRPKDDSPWSSSLDDVTPKIYITLSKNGTAEIGDISLPDSTRDNIESFGVLFTPPGGDSPKPYNPTNPSGTNPEVRLIYS